MTLRMPVLLTAGLVAARIAAVPALSDSVHGAAPAGLHLSAPWLYVVLAPLFTVWDGVSMLGMSRLHGFLVGCAVLYLLWRISRARFIGRVRRRGQTLSGGETQLDRQARRRGTSLWRELVVLVLTFVLFLGFIAAGALWHRPMLSLAGAAPDEVVVDYHSHTSASHDVERFDLAANRHWHDRAGFDAFFVTDHNTTWHTTLDPPRHEPGMPDVCPGTEISGWGAHTLLLGPTPPITRADYGEDHGPKSAGLVALLSQTDSVYGTLSIASLPEYEEAHWHGLDRLVAAGLDGFEIVNASPKANEMTPARRDTVIALARRADRLVVGVSDNHGWGATSMVWNLVTLPGWREREAPVCAALLARLRTGFTANRIIERHRLRAESWWPGWLTPVGVIWEIWRSMSWTLTASWLIWMWVTWLLLGYLSLALHHRTPHAALVHSRDRLRRP